MAEFIDDGGGPLDRFTTRATAPPAMFSGDGGAGGRGPGTPSLSSLPGSGDPGSNLSAGGSSFPASAAAGGSSPFDGGGPGARQQHQVAAGGGGGGQPAEMEMDMSAFDGKDLDWSVFSASPSMFSISGGGGGGPDGSGGAQSQSQSSRSQQGSPGGGGGGRGGRDVPHQDQLSGLPPPSSGSRPMLILGKDSSGDNANGGGLDMNAQSHGSRSSSLGGGGGGSCGVLGLNSGSRTGSFSSGGTGTPPLAGRSMATAPWNIMGGPPVRSIDGGGGGGAPPRAAESSPRAGMAAAGTLAGMKKLSITSDDSNSGVGCTAAVLRLPARVSIWHGFGFPRLAVGVSCCRVSLLSCRACCSRHPVVFADIVTEHQVLSVLCPSFTVKDEKEHERLAGWEGGLGSGTGFGC